jgi:hypothetical protein
MGQQGDPMRAACFAHLGESAHDRDDYFDLAEHCRGEDVQARPVLEEEFGDVSATHVSCRPKRRLPVSATPIPRAMYQLRLLGEQPCDRVEIAMGVADEGLDQLLINARRLFWHDYLPESI